LTVLFENFEVIASVFGTLASVLGAILTVVFSMRAKSAAESASEAAKLTKEQLGRMSILTSLNEGLRIASDLNERLASKNWEIIAERATGLRLIISPLLTSNPDFFSEELNDNLVQLIGQVKDIAGVADRVRFNSSKEPDTTRLRRIVSDQREVLLIAIEQAKQRLAADDTNS
jgi:hypothetical protein